MTNSFPEFDDILQDIWKTSQAMATGIWDSKGDTIFLNPAMQLLLKYEPERDECQHRFVNPQLIPLAKNAQDGLFFEGILTLGDGLNTSYSLQACAYKNKSHILVVAETDPVSVLDENTKMSRLNQEINALQRDLLKEKKRLSATLLELKETQELLVHSEKMNAMGQLVAGLAHEINNPLSFVYSNVFSLKEAINAYKEAQRQMDELIREQDHSDAIQKVDKIRQEYDIDFLDQDLPVVLEDSLSGLKRLRDIVDNLRDFSRLDRAEVDHQDLVQSVDTTSRLLQSEFKERNIRLHYEGLPMLMADFYPAQFNQVVMNILINAIQAIDKDGDIRVKFWVEKDMACVSIADTGPGIDENNLPKVFDPFFTTKDVGKGMGIGLSISYKIIQTLHKGEILALNNIPRGAKFVIRIPLILE